MSSRGVFLEQKTEATWCVFFWRAVFFLSAEKEACCGRFLEQKKSAAGFLLESNFSAAEERQSCSCAVWFLCRKNKLQQQVFIQHKKT